MAEKSLTCKNPLFLKFINGEASVSDIVYSISKSRDQVTSEIAKKALDNPLDLTEFKKEITDAVRDLIRQGAGEEFTAFVNHYMESALIEDVVAEHTPHGENKSRTARIIDENAPWVQAVVCYNLCLYIRAFGLDELKECKVCGKLFGHKGKYAVYCSDQCKSNKKRISENQAGKAEGTMPPV